MYVLYTIRMFTQSCFDKSPQVSQHEKNLHCNSPVIDYYCNTRCSSHLTCGYL